MKNYIFNEQECGSNNKVNNYLKENWEILHNKKNLWIKKGVNLIYGVIIVKVILVVII